MMRKALGIGVFAVLTGCGAPSDHDERMGETGGTSDAVETAELPLSVGSVGPEVAQVTRALTSRGYLPNSRLRQRFPDWNPVVAESVADPLVFDNTLEQAVQAFQADRGLEQTGRVDGSLFELMQRPHCGVPRARHSELTDKWARNGVPWRERELTYNWSLPQQMGGLPLAVMASQLDLAFATWGALTGIEFTRVSGASDIFIDAEDLWDPPSNDLETPDSLAETDPFRGELIRFDTSEDWSGSDGYDFLTVALHELGHALGFDHSNVGSEANPPVMWPDLAPDTAVNLNGDDFDALAISPYSVWKLLAGRRATDVGAGTLSTSDYGFVWIASDEPASHGYTLYYYDNWSGIWEAIDGSATRVDVAGNVPWVVTKFGQVYSRTGVTSSNPKGSLWRYHGDPNATDIGVSRNGHVWIIDDTVANGHGNRIYRYDGNETWTRYNGGAEHIDVMSNGIPVVTTEQGHVYKGNGGSGWIRLPDPPGNPGDITVDSTRADVIWITVAGVSGGTYQLNPQTNRWVKAEGGPGGSVNVGMTGYGRPIIQGPRGDVYWRLPPGAFE